MARGHGYRTKMMVAFLMLAMVPLTALYSFYAYSSWNARRNQLLDTFDRLLSRDASDLDGLLLGGVRRMTMVDRNLEIQNYLAASVAPSAMESIDLFYRLNAFFVSLGMDSQEWRFRIYTPRGDISAISAIRHVSELDPQVRARIDSLPGGVVLLTYRQVEGDISAAGSLYLYKKNSLVGGALSSIVEVRMGMRLLQDVVRTVGLPNGGFVVYSIGDGSYLARGLGSGGASFLPTSEHVVGEASASSRYHRIGKAVHEGFAAEGSLALYIPRSYVLGEAKGLLVSLAAVYLLIVAVLVGGLFLTSSLLTARLYGLLHDMDRDMERMLSEDQETLPSRSDEFDKIARKFHELIRKVRQYYSELTRAEVLRKQLELELLQDLINPHFLYNTLDGIKWAVRDERLTRVVDSLVRYYRTALNKGKRMLSVGRELEMITDYLELQRFGFESHFTYEIGVPEDVRRCVVPKHLLQPVVENSVLHGIRKQGCEGHIRITGRRKNGVVHLRVADNGAGIEREKIAEILAGAQAGASGYGLSNVQKRIRVLYGDPYGLNILSEIGVGTEVEITVPVVEEQPERATGGCPG